MKFKALLFLTLIIYLLLPLATFSQTKKIDSLKTELQNHKAKDTTRVNLLNAIALKFFKSDLSKTLEYLEKSDKLSDSLNFEKGKARNLYIRGVVELMQSNYDNGIQYFEDAIQLYNDIDFKKDLAVCYLGIGIINYYRGHNEEALINYKKAQQIDKELGIKKNSITINYNIGIVYVAMGKYQEGLTSYKESLELYRQKNDKTAEANVLNSMANIYKDLGDYPSALEHYNKSLSTSEKINDSIGIARALVGIGNINKVQLRNKEALEYLKRSLLIQEKRNNKKNVATVKNSIASIYEIEKDFTNAIRMYKEALEISREIKAEDNISSNLRGLGSIYLQKGKYDIANNYYEESKQFDLKNNDQTGLRFSYVGLAKVRFQQEEYDEALKYANKSKEISEKLGLVSGQSTAHRILTYIYEKKGDYKKALESHRQFKIFNDSIFNKENIEKITQLEYEYKYKQALDSASIRELKLTKTVLTTSQDLEKSKRNLFLGVIGFLVTALILGGIIFSLRLRNEKSKAQNAIIEQKLLRSQMTPHFMFNSLSVLQGMILNKEYKKSVFYLSKFSKLLRITLENSRDKLVPLNQELEAVNSYLELQNLEENQSYDYTILIDESIDETLFKIPPMLIQPFIENAIEHAFKTQKENRKIDIKLKYTNNELICTIADNGVGIDTPNGHKRKDKKSLATAITSERLKMLSKDLNSKGSITIENRKQYNEQGTIVTLVMPYKKEAA